MPLFASEAVQKLEEEFEENKDKELEEGRIAEDTPYAFEVNWTRDLAHEWTSIDELTKKLSIFRTGNEKGMSGHKKFNSVQRAMLNRKRTIKDNIMLNIKRLKYNTAGTELEAKNAALNTGDSSQELDEHARETLKKEVSDLEDMIGAIEILKKEEKTWSKVQQAIDGSSTSKGNKRKRGVDEDEGPDVPSRSKK